ncbi:hypothetical protein GINT2_002232 [Glugoides intestinalis]
MHSNISLKFTIKSLDAAIKAGKTTFFYNNVEEEFHEKFLILIDDFHQVFFESIDIHLYALDKTPIWKSKNQFGAKINIKALFDRFNAQCYNTIEFEVPIVKKEDLAYADYYEKKTEIRGQLHLSVSKANIEMPFGYVPTPRFVFPIGHSWLFDKCLGKYITKIMYLAFQVQQGTVFCKIKVVFGFLVLQMMASRVFGICDGMHADKCGKEECFGTYKKVLGKNRAKRFMKALQYSAAAYVTSPIPVFAPKKLRSVNTKTNAKRKFVLERANINEKDIVKISSGTVHSPGFVAFFDRADQLVITFRGCCSKEDVFKILDTSYVPLMDGFTHSGILRQVMQFLNVEFESILKEMKKRRCKKILFVGHSLGAAVGILSHICLKNIKILKNEVNISYRQVDKLEIHTIVFSAPPIISKNLADKHCSNIEVINLEGDIITEISFGSILDFKYLCVSIGCLKTIFINRDNFIKKINDIREYLKKVNIHEKLYCPGKIIYLRASKSSVFRYKEVPATYFNELKIGVSGLMNHLMFKIAEALKYFLKVSHENKKAF